MLEYFARHRQTILWACGLLLLIICGFLSWLSFEFFPDLAGADRPLLIVIGLLLAAFGVYAIAWAAVGGFSGRTSLTHQQSSSQRRLLWVVIGFGFAFRIVLVFSNPIQEIDLYRYIWDGGVVTAGGNPYRFSPQQAQAIVDSSDPLEQTPPDARRLRELVLNRPGLRLVLNTIHYGQFNSPYPPGSQVAFVVAVWATPSDAAPLTYVRTMKAVLMMFDAATMAVVIWMLSLVNWSRLLVVGYWWCPLILKEFTNSGHLDSVVVFFLTTGIAVTAWLMTRARVSFGNLAISGLLLAMGVAAKIFPIILFPLWAIACWRVAGFRRALMVSFGSTIVAIILCWPMLRLTSIGQSVTELSVEQNSVPARELTGIEAFSKWWEMNDLIFMIVVENLKQHPEGDTSQPWFVVTSDSWRAAVGDRVALVMGASPSSEQGSIISINQKHEAVFVLTRIMSMSVILGLSLFLGWRIWQEARPIVFLESCFLVLAWFWMLSPTQNPWYWAWAMPLLVFARGRSWFLVSGLLTLYYLRFWCDYHLSGIPLMQMLGQHIDGYLGTSGVFSGWNYTGTTLFDFVIPWIEFGPVLVLLFVEWAIRRGSTATQR